MGSPTVLIRFLKGLFEEVLIALRDDRRLLNDRLGYLLGTRSLIRERINVRSKVKRTPCIQMGSLPAGLLSY